MGNGRSKSVRRKYWFSFKESKKKDKEDIDVIISGDLMNQITSSCYSSEKFNFPFLGIYSACATSIEGVILGSSLIDSGKVKNVISSTSSHNMSSEKTIP